MATSRTTRALDYLGSTANLAGSGLALVALFVTTITGLGGPSGPCSSHWSTSLALP